ncbi:hypothetical protein [Pelagicoccus sp. SDUM812002]|uniref:hypothetical protein n=1 Tax=Pelagicoccus sp. SDUM812002 TaxID=3041266 RepID=UPI00280CAB7E|nr:hypothetical protein [Pelagicoccus sp. SDUM812002]MDQ8184279.1 hypothetical protein [Pelagicoccus sp. SDUM812002]
MAILKNTTKALEETLKHPPEPGQRNVWLYTVAKRAKNVASREKIRSFLLSVASQWNDRDFTPEIDRAIARAFEERSAPSEEDRIPPWPEFSQDAWNRRIDHPILFGSEGTQLPASEVIDRLFSENALLCLALDTKSAVTQLRQQWRGKEAAMQFLVPNAMTKETGITQSGHPSPRCLDNATKSKVYQVVEFDRGTLKEQAAILSSLHTEYTPLIMVVYSGGKSLHGWFDVRTLDEASKLRFFRHSVFLGSDASLWDASKLVRMPGGRRDNGKTQSILFFNPIAPKHP